MSKKKRVFICFSGERSRLLGEALERFISRVCGQANPFISAHHVEAGERWGERLDSELNDINIGGACITKEGQDGSWLHFEAGALSKNKEIAHVCPYLLDVEKGEIRGPLSRFQALEATEQDTKELVLMINKELEKKELSDESEVLDDRFTKYWPDLRDTIEELRKQSETKKQTESKPDLADVLERIEGVERWTRSVSSQLDDISSRQKTVPASMSFETPWEKIVCLSDPDSIATLSHGRNLDALRACIEKAASDKANAEDKENGSSTENSD